MLGVATEYPSYVVFLAVFISAALTCVLMPFWIRCLRKNKVGQQVRADGPQRHLQKQGTPTMGGVIILLSVALTCVLLAPLNAPLAAVLGATLLTGLLGCIDDISSVSKKRSLGLTAHAKLIGQAVIVIAFTIFAVNVVGVSPVVTIPGIASIDLGVLTTTIAGVQIPWLYLIFVYLLIGGFSNAVNFNDGLDGLCGGCTAATMVVMGMVAYVHGELSLAVLAFACVGACIGFLWFNCYPASIFMGDTGSLALGCAFAALAVCTKSEVESLVIGAIFIIEVMSVIIQVVSYKLTHKRVFLMAPIHHHFEKMGWAETKVVTRFWIVTFAFAAIGFALYFQVS